MQADLFVIQGSSDWMDDGMTKSALPHCPIRGGLRVAQRASDALTFSEEKYRIDAVRYLLQRKYPEENFGIETVRVPPWPRWPQFVPDRLRGI